MREVVIVSAVRTPIGKFLGNLKSLSAVDLGTIAVNGALEKAGIRPEQVEDVVAGMVYKAGAKGNPARQVQIKVGIPVHVGATTIDQQCASAMRAFEVAVSQIMLGKSDISVAFGIESMSNVPHLLLNARTGYKLGGGMLEDGLLYDALLDAFSGKHMGLTAEKLAEMYHITREEQDELAELSHQRAVAAQNAGKFDSEIIPVAIKNRKGTTVISQDECPNVNTTTEVLSKLKPAFIREGSVTAGNASSINDGSAAIVLMSAQKAKELKIQPLARVVSTATVGVEPSIMGIGPVEAIPKALAYADLKLENMDYFEINEAFAAQFIAVNRELKLPMEKVNANGSGISLGHPVGCTGIRIIVSLLSELKRRNGQYGCASLCVGGGPAMATIIENIIIGKD
ncbi:thiolase family protein [Crassaminicella profunda]|uniref:thiolase family protein n=1 Tax=Crassaminicella profunda TaxID=1286698 RepID=UPI001CA657B8|nr:thiolase family protein [Crassaminicella profunda]QZY54075.1 thiolase family protein [Crassaminicella profunda]